MSRRRNSGGLEVLILEGIVLGMFYGLKLTYLVLKKIFLFMMYIEINHIPLFPPSKSEPYKENKNTLWGRFISRKLHINKGSK